MADLYYTGIGSRQTPKNVLLRIETIAEEMAHRGWILRSGGADGADSAFEKGCDRANGKKEIFLPWKEFNNNQSTLTTLPKEAYTIAYKFHPNPDALKKTEYGKELMARNTLQILGKDLETPTIFVICWTPDGIEDGNKTSRITGGTGQAIRIADAYNIPVLNIKNRESLEILNSYFTERKSL